MSIVFENSTATCSVFVTVVLRQPAGLFKGGALLEEEEADQEERSFLQRHISPTRVSTPHNTERLSYTGADCLKLMCLESGESLTD